MEMKYFKSKIILSIFVCLFLSSCNGWTERDRKKYLLECQRAKLDSTFCDCSLDKIIVKYSSFENAMQNEEEFIEIFEACKNND
tara:strand:- start:2977 stop:3228 length:252 start_codon:yes stop_codon:yes gene_type:complete